MKSMTIDLLMERLEALADPKYREFSESLIPGSSGKSLGVRMPQLRALAKEICRGDWRAFLRETDGNNIYEIVMLRGLVIASGPCAFEERLSLLGAYIPEIENWAVCDCVAGSLHSVKKHLPEMLDFLKPYLESAQEFELRFAVVMLMDYFLTPEYIGWVLGTLPSLRHEGYYVKMAVAWAVSVAFVKFRSQTLELLESRALDPWVQNKSIQKCRESRRVSTKDKQMLFTLKV